MQLSYEELTVPIVFLVFNRPDNTQRVFEVIRSVKPKKLYVAADAPREHIPEDELLTNKVREIVSSIDWDCDARYLFHDHNLGCSLAGKTAWDWVFSQEDEIIFLEDDGLVSRSFFYYCQVLLKKYKDDQRIAYIGGVNYGLKYGDASYYFSLLPAATYSMATWKRVYDMYEYKMGSYMEKRNCRYFITNFPSKFMYRFMRQKFDEYVRKGGNTYDIQMNYLAYKNRMYSIHPNINLSSNIGLSGGGANNNFRQDSKIVKMLGNRPRYEIAEITHPVKVDIDNDFERQYFNKRWFINCQTYFYYFIKLILPIGVQKIIIKIKKVIH